MTADEPTRSALPDELPTEPGWSVDAAPEPPPAGYWDDARGWVAFIDVSPACS
jgi:hypothetical protein